MTGPTEPNRNMGRSDDPFAGISDNEITVPNIFGGAQRDDDPADILPGLAAEPVAEQPPAWEQQPPASSGSTPPPTAMYPAAESGYAAQAGDQWQSAAPTQVPPPAGAQMLPTTEYDQDSRRRRNALLGVLGVIALTVAVVITALVFAPKWNANKNEPPPTPRTSASVPASDTVKPTPSSEPTVQSPSPESSAEPSAEPSPEAPRTVTVTATASSPAEAAPTTTAAASPTNPATTAAPVSTPKPSTVPSPASPTTAPTTPPSPTKPTPTSPANPLGVPQQNIACSNGYIVQLASEIDEAAFKRRITALRAADMLPAGAKVADSTAGCQIFANQRNTLVLYAGPFNSKYDGCNLRFAGPADSFIKGANPDASREYISCVCPGNAGSMPVLRVGDAPPAWVGELQRVLTRAGFNVGPLGPKDWGVMTPGTQDAIKRFQQANRLPANGVVDAGTWAKLKSSQGC